jgi:hypothetical protein
MGECACTFVVGEKNGDRSVCEAFGEKVINCCLGSPRRSIDAENSSIFIGHGFTPLLQSAATK